MVGFLLHHMDGIFVETASMSEKLIEFGLKNVLVMPNSDS